MKNFEKSNNIREVLIGDFGKRIGINDLELDENGHCCLGFDSVILNIDYNESNDIFVINSKIGEIPDIVSNNLLRRIEEINLAALMNGTGAVGVDYVARKIVFVDRVLLRDLTLDDFEALIQSTVNRVEALASVVTAQAFTQGDEKIEPRADSEELFIRA